MTSPKLFFFIIICIMSVGIKAQTYWDRVAQKPSTLKVEDDDTRFITKSFSLTLVDESQTVKRLSPLSDTSFDYTPGERLNVRDKDGMYHLGDINIETRKKGGEWSRYSTAASRKPVKKLPVTGKTFAAADLSATLPADIPLKINRYWETDNGDLVLRFEIKNITNDIVEIGALGIPLIFNNILEGKSLDEAHLQNVFFDPYIGMNAGYLQVNRLHGKGGSMLVIPSENAPFEAYNPLNDDPTPRSIVFEGFHEWLVRSKSVAEREWGTAQQWNTPTSEELQPGKTKNYSLKFVMAPSIREIENKLVEVGMPVAVGFPGYVLPQNENGKLFINHNKKIKEITVSPDNALTITKGITTKNGWDEYNIKGNVYSRARISIIYDDNSLQTINYKVINSQEETVANMGRFLTNQQWYDNKNDQFGRSPSVMNYDYDEKHILTQERRSWFVGLSDEAGAGSWLAAIMKQLIMPDKAEIAKLKRFVNETMWGGIQYSSGDEKYGVRKSMFYYEPELMPKGTYSGDIKFAGWEAWSKENAESVERSYNYPHVAAAHWVMYHLGRNRNMKDIDWRTSLANAYETSIAMVNLAPYYAQFGQMEGSVFYFILQDLKREGWLDMAQELELQMKKRADHWKSLDYPFGSEMPWDSTGQEEVYVWTNYFGYKDKADVTLNAVLAYAPAIPNWGYNGSARRYWDFVYGGKLARIERQLHHYGSALNAIPILEAYRQNPNDFHLLKVGYAGSMGALANITNDGFAPSAFHSYPSTMEIDGYTCDYGSGFYGYTVNSSTFVYNHQEFGWLAFGGNINQNGQWIETEVTTAGKNRVFIATENLELTTVAGRMNRVNYNPSTREVAIECAGDVLLDVKTAHNSAVVFTNAVSADSQGYYMVKADKKGNSKLMFKIQDK